MGFVVSGGEGMFLKGWLEEGFKISKNEDVG